MALGTIPFTITETAGVARNGGTNASMRFPVAVPLRFDEAKTSTATFRVVDTTTSAVVPAAYEVAARWGDLGNTSHRIKVVHVYLMPILNANESRTFQLQTTGGSGDSTGGITVTTQAGYYEVNTGTAGITARVPRTGPMAPLILTHLNAIAGATGDVINGTGSAVWMLGIAGAGPSPSPANNQGTDFFSNLDSTTDSSDNGGDPTETSRPGRYHTSIAFQNSQRVRIKIDTVRCRNASNVEFRGMNREVAPNNGGSPTAQVATWDVYLDFYRNSTAIRRQFVFKSSGGDYDQFGGLRSDCAIDGMGDDIALAYTGALQMATRDESAATKVARATSATAGTIRQLTNPSARTSWNFTLPRTGPITFTGTPVTQTEAFFDMTAADGSRGLLRIPHQWRNKFPMGWAYTPSTGRLRWEMLNTDHAEVDRNRSYHVILGHHWFHAEEWLVPHAGTLTDSQLTDLVRALGGRHEVKVSGSWQDATPTGPGAQQPTLLGTCSADHWDDTRAWRRVPPATLARPDLLNTPGFLGLAGQLAGSVSKADDADNRLNLWMDTYHDQSASDNGVSYRSFQAVPSDALMSPLGHRYYGGHPTSGSFQFCGANDYEYNSYPIYHWWRRNDRGDFQVAWEGTLHCVTIDQFHNFYDTSAGVLSGRLTDFNGHNVTFHSSNRFQGFEYQQNFEAPALLYLVTGEEFFLEALHHYLNSFNAMLYGDVSGGEMNVANYQTTTGDVQAIGAPGTATITNVANPERFVAKPGSSIRIRPDFPFPQPQGGTLTSSGITITVSTSFRAWVLGSFGAQGTDQSNANRSLWIGASIRAAGQTRKIVWLNNNTSGETDTPFSPPLAGATWELLFCAGSGVGGKLTAINGTTFTVAWSGPVGAQTGVTIRAATSRLPRMVGWQLAALIGFSKIVGQFATNAQGTHDLYQRIHDCARCLIYTEQAVSSAGALAALGGTGAMPTAGEVAGLPMMLHGRFGALSSTYHGYPAIPLLVAHEFADLMVAAGQGTAIFTSAYRTLVLDYLVRWGQFTWMGTDGLSPLKGATVSTAKRIPWGRGGDLASATSYQAPQARQFFAFAEEPTRAGRDGVKFFTSAEDLNDLTVHTGDNFMQGGSGSLFSYVGADVLAYCADKKWNATGQLALRDAWLRQAIELGTAVLTLSGETHPSFGTYVNPTTYPPVRSMFAANGAVAGGIRAKHWAIKHHGYWMRPAKDGFGTVTPDTTAPTETQLLALVSKTDTQIVVDGPAATDNVAVVDYLFFKDGVQDGAPQAGTAHTFTGLTPSTTYSLKRRARDAVPNTSGDSNTLSIQTNGAADTTAPTVPTGLQATATETTVTLTWLPSTDEESGIKRYLIERTPPGSIVGEVVP